MNVLFENSFLKDLKKISDRKIKFKIENNLDLIKNSPNISSLKNVKKIKGTSNAYRIRIGNYRIGIFINSNVCYFVRVLNRNDIYKYFP